MKKNIEDYTIENIKNELDRKKKLRPEIQKHFDFEIVNYILDDIIDGYDFLHICLMINMARLNNRITEENAEELKVRLKEIYKIKSMYDKIIM